MGSKDIDEKSEISDEIQQPKYNDLYAYNCLLGFICAIM